MYHWNTTYILLRQNISLVQYLQRINIVCTTFTSHLNFTKMSMSNDAFHVKIIDTYLQSLKLFNYSSICNENKTRRWGLCGWLYAALPANSRLCWPRNPIFFFNQMRCAPRPVSQLTTASSIKCSWDIISA